MDAPARRLARVLVVALVALNLTACAAGAGPKTNAGAQTSSGPSAVVPGDTSTPPASAAAPSLTSGCPGKLTPAQTEGPYFKSGSSERASLLTSGMPGTRLVLSGRVTGVYCQPIAHALLDFWQADSSGRYDNSGYTLRGHVFSDTSGMYRLETIVPGLYTGRTEHIHLKVQAPGGPILTTQLYFPGVTQNDTDGIFDPALLMAITDQGSTGRAGTYDFAVAGG